MLKGVAQIYGEKIVPSVNKKVWKGAGSFSANAGWEWTVGTLSDVMYRVSVR